MIALGIILLLVAVALAVGAVATGTSQDVVFTSDIGDLTTQPVWIFLSGVLATVLALLGLSVMQRGTRRRVAQRREVKRLRQVEQEKVELDASRQQAHDQQVAQERVHRTAADPVDPVHPADPVAPAAPGEQVDLRTADGAQTTRGDGERPER